MASTNTFIGASLIVTACCILTGCLVNHSQRSIVRQHEPLRPISFESDIARQGFESKVKQLANHESNVAEASFGVPFILGLKRSKRLSTAAVRNDAATELDINRDGVISEYEISLKK